MNNINVKILRLKINRNKYNRNSIYHLNTVKIKSKKNSPNNKIIN